jgi:hypothetical protein
MLRVLGNSIAGATSLIRIFASLLILFVHGSSDSDGCLSGITLIALAPKDLVESSHGDLVFRRIKFKLKLWEDKEEERLSRSWEGKAHGYKFRLTGKILKHLSRARVLLARLRRILDAIHFPSDKIRSLRWPNPPRSGSFKDIGDWEPKDRERERDRLEILGTRGIQRLQPLCR